MSAYLKGQIKAVLNSARNKSDAAEKITYRRFVMSNVSTLQSNSEKGLPFIPFEEASVKLYTFTCGCEAMRCLEKGDCTVHIVPASNAVERPYLPTAANTKDSPPATISSAGCETTIKEDSPALKT